MLVLLSGVSGAGKDTIKKELIKRMKNVTSLPSYTDRPVRINEIPGEIYNHVTTEEFEEMIKNEELYEYSLHHKHYYGTSRKLMNEKIQSGMSVVDALKASGFEVMPSNLRPIITEYEEVPGVVTTIKAELFEDLKSTQRFNHSSFYNMSKEIEMLRAQIEELEQSKGL